MRGFALYVFRILADSLLKHLSHELLSRLLCEFDILSLEFKGKRLDPRSKVSRFLAFVDREAESSRAREAQHS